VVRIDSQGAADIEATSFPDHPPNSNGLRVNHTVQTRETNQVGEILGLSCASVFPAAPAPFTMINAS
jgi:hypothetical protein